MPITTVCDFCREPFSRPPSSQKRFCGWKCFQKWVNQGGTRKGATLSCTICGAEFYVSPNRTQTAKYCSYQCHQVGEGRKGGEVRGEQVKKQSKGKSYTKTKGEHTHRVVAAAKLGRKLRKKEVVHHKNGNILDNRPENLEVLASQADHVRLHHAEMIRKRIEIHGR